jgi:hypothetical protein
MPTVPGVKYVIYILEVDKSYRDSLPNPYVYTNDDKRSETVELLARQFGLPNELLASNVVGFDAAITKGINDWLNVRYTPGNLTIYAQVQGKPGKYAWNVLAKIRSLPE